MYLYFDKTGKLKEIINDEALRQGNFGVNKMYVYFDKDNVVSLDVSYLLPSGLIVGPQNYTATETTQIPFDAKRDLLYFKYYQDYTFFVIDLEQDINGNSPLDETGTVHCDIKANISGQVIPVLGEFNFYVEQTSTFNVRQVASQEYLSLADYQFLRSLITDDSNETKIYVISNISTADLSNFTDGQLIYDKETELYYEVDSIEDDGYKLVENTIGLLGSKGTIARYLYDPVNNPKDIAEMYTIFNTRMFVLNIQGQEYLFKLIDKGSNVYDVSAVNIVSRTFWRNSTVSGSNTISSILISTYQTTFVEHRSQSGNNAYVNVSGTDTLMKISSNAEGGIMSRNSSGQTKVGEPTENSHAATKYYVDTQDASVKNYVDTQDATKLDKVTNSYPYQRLYGVSTSGVQQMFAFSSSAIAYQVVQRKYDSNITVPVSPSTVDDATSKAYVDSKATNVQNALQTEINKAGHYLAISGGQSTDYTYTISLKDKNNNVIDTINFDLPLESVVVDGYYDSANKEIVLELDNGSTVEIPVGDLISGLASQTDLDALALTVTQLSNAAFKYTDVIITGGYVSELKVNNVNYPIAQNVTLYTTPKTVENISDLPATNDGYLYLVLSDGYLYAWDITQEAYVQAYEYVQDVSNFVQTSRTIAGINLANDITAQALTDALVFMNNTTDLDYVMED